MTPVPICIVWSGERKSKKGGGSRKRQTATLGGKRALNTYAEVALHPAMSLKYRRKLRSSETPNIGAVWLAVGAVSSELVSVSISLIYGKIQGNFTDFAKNRLVSC